MNEIQELVWTLTEQAVSDWGNGLERLFPTPEEGWANNLDLIWNVSLNFLAYGFMKGLEVSSDSLPGGADAAYEQKKEG